MRVRTATGERFSLTDPDPGDVKIIDIATALSRTPKWGGQTPAFFSVAEHCVIMAGRVDLPKHALIHEAFAAYMGNPMFGCSHTREMGMEILATIVEGLGLEWSVDIHNHIAEEELRMTKHESYVFFGHGEDAGYQMQYLNPDAAYAAYVAAWRYYTGEDVPLKVYCSSRDRRLHARLKRKGYEVVSSALPPLMDRDAEDMKRASVVLVDNPMDEFAALALGKRIIRKETEL